MDFDDILLVIGKQCESIFDSMDKNEKQAYLVLDMSPPMAFRSKGERQNVT